MNNPLNTLFGRMALMSALVLFIVQACWFVVFAPQPRRHEVEGFERGLLLMLHAANGAAPNEVELAPALRVHLVPTWNMPADVDLKVPKREPLADLRKQLLRDLPPGTEILADLQHRRAALWVRFPGHPTWIVAPVDLPPPPNLLPQAIGLLAMSLLVALLAMWQMQRPLSLVANAARAFGSGHRPEPVNEQGPRELRDLIGSFNRMMKQLNEADDDQAVMLAGVAHDLKSPLTRIKLRASMLGSDLERQQLYREVDSLNDIVQQFLEFARQRPESGPEVEVDALLREQYYSDTGSDEDVLFRLDLRAGPAFRMPRTLLDRLISNLVDNALEHGVPPVEISTRREGTQWLIEVRDHGPGIPADRVAAAIKPFVRLDEARGGEGHCGLGLAIITRLVRNQGGQCDLSNHPEGGLRVRISLPVL
ncbi:two-component system osmolarity sensor histidine kinase EnvZ [Paraburkholderia bannensis]|uniref:histidine kinase n=1 Tax=Paraburkholderia bannensis TaxID=765414 RepID=A0A7W9U059_9BURK|nr:MULTISPECIES: ATP-binding protein [Paraburkholderia]MBB3258422.1 two-component system osmolarity sensor histidine kinase EnvZ [Paraburkholderia sp. WP4_3_2]MBB6103435.1 two-component system osmolarity sensor histidine kinase EnvZ [Paraburkholderia bannensis]